MELKIKPPYIDSKNKCQNKNYYEKIANILKKPH
jgi:hypothetical protein